MSYARNFFEGVGLLKNGHYSFQVGAPGPAFLKQVAGYLETASKAAQKNTRYEETLQYGCGTGGYPVKVEVANFLTRQYGHPVKSEDIFVTQGASSGLHNLLTHFFQSNHKIFCENPTYPVFAMQIQKNKWMTPDTIEMQSDGMDLDELEKKCSEMELTPVSERWPFRAAVYVISVHHNPTGFNYSPEKCKRLVQLARKYDLLVIADDVYNALNYKLEAGGSKKFEYSSKRLFAYDDINDPDYTGNVVSNGSFAKIIAPGLRMGWFEAPKRVIDSLINSYVVQSGSGQCAFSSYVVAEALKNGDIDNHVQNLRLAHKDRMSKAIFIVEEKLKKHGVTISHPDGGYFLWIKLPENVMSADVLEEAKNENVTFVKGELASVVGNFKNYIRLSIAYYELDDIEKGITKLCSSIDKVIQKRS